MAMMIDHEFTFDPPRENPMNDNDGDSIISEHPFVWLEWSEPGTRPKRAG
jgi:hypothetical protein